MGTSAGERGKCYKVLLQPVVASPFVVEDIVYKTAEHWMMAEKARLFKDEATVKLIIAAETAAAAKKLGRQIADFNNDVWDREKYNIVLTGNFHKFSQHASLQAFLLSTGSRILVEASPVDAIWGIGLAEDHKDINNPVAWRGENLLGYALMEVRDKLGMI